MIKPALQDSGKDYEKWLVPGGTTQLPTGTFTLLLSCLVWVDRVRESMWRVQNLAGTRSNLHGSACQQRWCIIKQCGQLGGETHPC